jgi:hypothetical protein
MPTRKTLTDEIEVSKITLSVVYLRNARAELATVPQPHDSLTFKARIDLCNELINRVGEIDRNLRQLTSDLRRDGDIRRCIVASNSASSRNASRR